MRKADLIQNKIFNLPDLVKRIAQWRILGKTVAFTNGVFDIMHRGHIASLSEAAREADYLIVGLNSDASTQRLKGPTRPVNDEQARQIVMASLLMVDAVVLFEEDTPLELIKAVMPDVLVKGGDYTEEQIVGAREVKANGGKIVINPIVQGYSTTGLIDKINKL